MKSIIHSIKHPVQITLSTSTTGATTVITICDAVNATVANTVTEVKEGSTIKAVWLEMWTIGSISNQFFTAIFAKLPSGLGNIAQADMVDLYNYENKKNIFYTTQGLASNDGIAGPHLLYKGWIKIPKGKQRFGLGDRLQFALSSRGSDDIIWCGLALYKEYS